MKNFDLDSDLVDLAVFAMCYLLVGFAEFRPEVDDRLYEFSLLCAGSALRGLGTHKKKDDYFEDGDRQ